MTFRSNLEEEKFTKGKHIGSTKVRRWRRGRELIFIKFFSMLVILSMLFTHFVQQDLLSTYCVLGTVLMMIYQVLTTTLQNEDAEPERS